MIEREKHATAKKVFKIIFWVIIVILPLIGMSLAVAGQIQAQYEAFGYFDRTKHIWGSYDFWWFTLIAWTIPLTLIVMN